MSSNPGGAGAGAAPGRLTWAVLERAVEFVEPEALPGDRVEYAIKPKHAAPNLCNLQLSRALLAGDEGEDVQAFIDCADSDGNLVVSVWGAAAGPPRLLVCRAGTGTVDRLPEVPDHVDGGLERELGAASTGILPAAGQGGHYRVVQLQRAAAGTGSPSSSSSAAAKSRMLCFCSASQAWTSKVVAAPGHPRHLNAVTDEDEEDHVAVGEAAGKRRAFFEPHTVVACGRAMLAFLDIKEGALLLLDPAAPATATTVPLPSTEEDGDAAEYEDQWEAATRRFVAWSQGCLTILQIANNGTLVMHRLEQGRQDLWKMCYRVPRDRILWSNPGVALRLAEAAKAEEGNSDVGVGPVDPANRNRISFFSFDAGLAFKVEIDPGKSSACFCNTADVRGLGTCLHVVSCLLDVADPAAAEARAPSTWRRTLKRTGSQAWHAFNVGRKHVHRIPPLAQVGGLIGTCIGIPHASTFAAAVGGLPVLDQALTASEDFLTWWNEPSPMPNNGRLIRTTQDAAEAIHDWIVAGKPPGSIVYPASDLSKEQRAKLLEFMITERAGQLLPVSAP